MARLMLSKLVVSSYAVLIEVSLWVSLVGVITGTWQLSKATSGEGNILAAVFASVVWFVLSVVFFGGLLILNDIRQRVKDIEQTVKDIEKGPRS